MSDRPGPRSVMSKLDRLLIDGGKHYTTADRIYAEVIAPLLAEADRRGAERGWKRGVRDTIDARPWSSPLDSDNPYLEGK